MSQIEQNFRLFLSKNPEIEKCYNEGLINRRSLARYLIKKGIAKTNQMEATIGMLRRFNFSKKKIKTADFSKTKISIKDRITILDFVKEKELVQNLQNIIANTNYDAGDTLKIVIGTSNVKVFIDDESEKKVKDLIKKFKLNYKMNNISQISSIFNNEAICTRGIISVITKELMINDININEMLTASPELLIYIEEKYVLETYRILKKLQGRI